MPVTNLILKNMNRNEVVMDTVLFDLDGTLLPMDQDQFADCYFKELVKKFSIMGFEPEAFLKFVWKGTKAMMTNNGKVTNEVCFWDSFASDMGEEIRRLEPDFLSFYQQEFHKTRELTKQNPLAKECVSILKEKGYRLVLATNPLFPPVATHARIDWAGLKPEDFELITTYDNIGFCKPNLEYYKAILSQINKKPEDCLMIGNDIGDDMCAGKLGMATYLITDCQINAEGVETSSYLEGSFSDLTAYLNNMPSIS